VGETSFPHTVPERFWELVAEAQKGRKEFVHALSYLSRHDLLGFIWILQYLAHRIHPRGYRPYEAETEEGAPATASWVVAQGRAYFIDVYDNPKKFPAEHRADPGLERWALEVYRAKFHQDVPINEWHWDDKWQQKGKRSPWSE
jgi:hypothetical protein